MKKKTIYEIISEEKLARELRIQDLKDKLLQSEEDLKQAQERASNALTIGDVNAYQKAKSEEREAADKIEFYQIRLNTESKTLYTDEERSAKVSAIKSHYEEIEKSKMPVIVTLLKEAEAAVKDMQTEALKEAEFIGIVIGREDKTTNITQELLELNALISALKVVLNNSRVSRYNS